MVEGISKLFQNTNETGCTKPPFPAKWQNFAPFFMQNWWGGGGLLGYFSGFPSDGSVLMRLYEPLP
eukprot:3448239-Amphidinium_carterae.1